MFNKNILPELKLKSIHLPYMSSCPLDEGFQFCCFCISLQENNLSCFLVIFRILVFITETGSSYKHSIHFAFCCEKKRQKIETRTSSVQYGICFLLFKQHPIKKFTECPPFCFHQHITWNSYYANEITAL